MFVRDRETNKEHMDMKRSAGRLHIALGIKRYKPAQYFLLYNMAQYIPVSYYEVIGTLYYAYVTFSNKLINAETPLNDKIALRLNKAHLRNSNIS